MVNNNGLYLPNRRSDRGDLVIASCASGLQLATRIVQFYDKSIKHQNSKKKFRCLVDPPIDSQFLDGETRVRLEQQVRGADVYLFQSLMSCPGSNFSVNDNLMAYLAGIRALRQSNAAHITGVIPYHSYARQDKRTDRMREPITVGLVAQMAILAGVDQVVTWAPHSDLQVSYDKTPIDALDPLTLFSQEYSKYKGRADVIIVAPDHGASNFVVKLADNLNLSYALAAKHRPQPGVAMIQSIVGNFFDKKIVIIPDDMIASAGTMVALIKKIVTENPHIEEVYIGASHNLCLDAAYDGLTLLRRDYHLKGVMVTNSIPQSQKFLDLPFFHVRCLSEQLAHVINAIHYNESVSALTECS